MKTISLALFALLTTTQAVRFVPENLGGWVSPMENRDDGLEDETVVTQLNSKINIAKKTKGKDEYDHDPTTTSPYDGQQQHTYLPKYDKTFGNEEMANFEGAQIGTLMSKISKNHDQYDNDSNTVSPYDAMQQHQRIDKYDKDFGKPYVDFEGAQIGTLMAEIKGRRGQPDVYDKDPDTVSIYDHMDDAWLKQHQKQSLAQRSRKPDAFDDDKDTVSPYDAMDQDPKSETYGSATYGFAQKSAKPTKKAKQDAYDSDRNTVSPYDGMEVHAHIDKYEKDYGIENDLAQKH